MVAQNTVRTYGVNQVFRYVNAKLHRKSRQIRFYFFLEKTYFTSYVRNMFRATILYKYHGQDESDRYAGDIFPEPSFLLTYFHVLCINSFLYERKSSVQQFVLHSVTNKLIQGDDITLFVMFFLSLSHYYIFMIYIHIFYKYLYLYQFLCLLIY